ncbi:MAG: right-handed parallel beta-helix repeat-containing protein [Proteobacteria bacterium]|nr:right-handed parallel beta-helix repeat-containing protein [Pseudomonadota bacterium]
MTASALALAIAWISLAASQALGATLTVKAGESIQAAVKRALPGDRIEVEPGLYRETVFIDKDGIELSGIVRGGQWPVLDGENELNDGVLVSGHGVTIERLWVKRYKGNGIMTQGSNNYRIAYNVVEGPCFYAIFPQFGKNGLVTHNVAFGSEDAAIYVGMSDNVDVVHNQTYASIIGIESENSHDILIENNYVHDNVVGIATTMLPALPVKSSDRIIIRNNIVARNNMKNTAPPGDNDGVGVMVSETNFLVTTPDDRMDPFPDSTQVLRNVFLNNGSNPQGTLRDLLDIAGVERGVDVLATGKGRDHCIADRLALTTLGTRNFADCAPGTTSAAVASMQTAKPVVATPYTADQKGRLTYLAVCTGCHTYNSKLVGPPMVVIKALYGKDAQRLADYIAKPVRKRPDYPEMPSQDYLPEDIRLAVARYILSELSH